jgi:hypothetical protein
MAHDGGGGGWTYTATQVKNSLSGGANVNYGGDQQGQPTEVIYFNVGYGTGKFSGVTGGSLQTLPVLNNQPFCDPGDGSGGETTVGPVTGTTTINTTIYGQLIY